MAPDTYDFIVIGGGTAGIVLASRLSEDPDIQVLVLEAGVDQKDDPRVNIPALWSSLLKTSSTWDFDTVPQAPLGDRKVPFPQGRVLGGSSAVNGLIFTPTPKSTVEGWSKLGNPGWEWSSFSESLRKAYTLANKSSDAPGGDKTLQVSYPDDTDNHWASVWKDTLAGLGFSVSGDLFTGEANGLIVNPESVDPTTKQRSSSQSAYLAPAASRSNLHVLTEAVVDKIIFDTDTTDVVATGVQYTRGGQTETINARKEVVLAAGAINSPMILERSGIGSAELLKELGIEVVVDNQGVGEKLQNHFMVTFCAEVKDGLKTMDPIVRQDPTALAAAQEAYQKQTGPFATSGTCVTGQLPFPGIQTAEGKEDLEKILAKTLDGAPSDSGTGSSFDKAHEEFVRSMLASCDEASGCYITFPGWGAFNPDGTIAEPPAGTNGYFTIGLLSTHPLSRGSTHITSASGQSPGCVAVNPGYLSHPLDIEVFARNLRFLETLLAAEPLASQLKPSGKRNAAAPPAGGFRDLETARNYVRDHGLGGNHFVGGCSMMPREMGGVVDPKLRVYGTRNLRVCDASVIPLIPRANPQATVYGVAEHSASIIKSSM